MDVDREIPDTVAALTPALEDMDDVLVFGIAAEKVVEDDLAIHRE